MSGISPYLATRILNALFDNTPVGYSTLYVQLHVGDPGPLCTANPAVNGTRQAVPNGAASAGTYTSPNPVVWTAIPASETYAYISIWDSLTEGNGLWSGPLTEPVAVNQGDLSFTLATNALAISVT